LANSDYSHKRAEKIVYGKPVGNFYLICGKLQKKYRKMDDEEKLAEKKKEEKEEIEEAVQEPKSLQKLIKPGLAERISILNGASAIQKEQLLSAKGFRRVKTILFYTILYYSLVYYNRLL
jgi:hypothetical protein